jgi:restriction endonuclease S subunit
MAEPYLRCPASWRRATLAPDPSGDLVVRVETGSTPSTKRPEYWDGDIPWLTPKEITDLEGSVFVSRTARSITKEGLASSAAKLMAPGTVMLTKRAPVGAVAVNTVPMATNQGFLNFTCGSALLPAFLAAWLKANKPYLDLIANGSTYPELYLSDLFEFEIAVPPVGYQHRAVEVINSFQIVLAMESSLEQLTARPDELHLVHARVRKLRTLRETLLPLLLSGEVALPAAHDHVSLLTVRRWRR